MNLPAPSDLPFQLGVDSFVSVRTDPATGATTDPAERMRQFLEEVEQADRAGVDVFGVGEHHRPEFLDSAPAMILAAAATRTRRVRLTSAVTVLSAADPVRVFQQFATLDLLSQGRAEMVVGRGSFGEAFPLFGLPFGSYDSLFAENLDLLLKLRADNYIHWKGQYRPALTGQGVFPRPVQAELPVWLGVGGTPASFVRAGTLGLPLMVAIIGGEHRRFRPLVDVYREAGAKAGHPPERLRVGIHSFGYVAASNEAAADEFFPGYYEAFTRIGKERGWPPITRAGYEAARSPRGALLIGDPEYVAERVAQVYETFGSIARLTFQMSNGNLPHDRMLRAIELLGTRVAPLARERIAARASDSV